MSITTALLPPEPPPPRRSRKPRSVAYAIDTDGAEIVLVHLPCGATAKVMAEDYPGLCAAGFPGETWLTNDNAKDHRYVRVSDADNNTLMVARLLLQPGAGTAVRYRDGDPLNLRRDNLSVGAGRSKRREAEVMEAAQAASR